MNSIERYLEDIRSFGPVEEETEQALFRLFRAGNAAARQRLIAANMRFVVKVALRYRACSIPLPDLISEGALGLIQAVETFEPARGVRFISYAVWWIRSHITKAINGKAFLVRLPTNQYFRLRKATRAGEEASLPPEDLALLRQLSQGPMSLDAPRGGGTAWSDCLPDTHWPDPALEAEARSGDAEADAFLRRLSAREAGVLRKYYGLDNECPHSLQEVADSLDLSAERVRQIRKKAIAKIRKDDDLPRLRERMATLSQYQKS